MDTTIRTFFVVLFCSLILTIVLLSLKSLHSYAEIVFWAMIFSVPMRRLNKAINEISSGEERWAIVRSIQASPVLALSFAFSVTFVALENPGVFAYSILSVPILWHIIKRSSDNEVGTALLLTIVSCTLAFFFITTIRSMGRELRTFGSQLKTILWNQLEEDHAEVYLRKVYSLLGVQFPDSTRLLGTFWGFDGGEEMFNGIPSLLPGTCELVGSCMKFQPKCKQLGSAILKDIVKLSGMDWSKYAGIAGQYALRIAKAILASVDILFEYFIFMGLLSGMLSTKRSAFHYLNVVLADLGLGDTMFVKELKDLAENVVVDVTVKFLTTFMSTYLVYRATWHPIPTTLAMFSAIIGIIPFAPAALPYLLAICIMLAFRSWRWTLFLCVGLGFLNLHMGKYFSTDHGPKFGKEKIVAIRSMSAVSGLYLFGVKGVILGPLIFYTPLLFYRNFIASQGQKEGDK